MLSCVLHKITNLYYRASCTKRAIYWLSALNPRTVGHARITLYTILFPLIRNRDVSLARRNFQVN